MCFIVVDLFAFHVAE